MFDWFKSRDKLKRELLDEIEADARRKEEESMPQIQRIVSEEADKYRDSKEPWVTIIGDTINEDGSIQIALDWNDAFISYLKSNGIAGVDDTQIVQKWLAMISQQTAEKMKQLYVDTDGKVSEFT